MSLEKKRQVAMQRRIAGDVPPEEIRPGQRRVKNELPTDRLPEYDPLIGIGTIAGLNHRKQFIA